MKYNIYLVTIKTKSTSIHAVSVDAMKSKTLKSFFNFNFTTHPMTWRLIGSAEIKSNVDHFGLSGLLVPELIG